MSTFDFGITHQKIKNTLRSDPTARVARANEKNPFIDKFGFVRRVYGHKYAAILVIGKETPDIHLETFANPTTEELVGIFIDANKLFYDITLDGQLVTTLEAVKQTYRMSIKSPKCFNLIDTYLLKAEYAHKDADTAASIFKEFLNELPTACDYVNVANIDSAHRLMAMWKTPSCLAASILCAINLGIFQQEKAVSSSSPNCGYTLDTTTDPWMGAKCNIHPRGHTVYGTTVRAADSAAEYQFNPTYGADTKTIHEFTELPQLIQDAECQSVIDVLAGFGKSTTCERR